MALSTAYLPSMKNVGPILDALKDAGVPARFTNEFLKSLGFGSSNDRAIMGVLKGIGFLDQQSVPTELYRRYRDRTQSKVVLAEAMRDAYSDLFLAHQRANELSADKLKGFFAAKTDKGDRVVEAMALTFRALATHADFTKVEDGNRIPASKPGAATEAREEPGREAPPAGRPAWDAEFHYNIQIHLPATRDIAVYNAIFKSLRENLS